MSEAGLENFMRFVVALDEGAQLRVSSGVIETKGCSGGFGGCCAKNADLNGVADDIAELLGFEIDWQTKSIKKAAT